MKGPAYKIAIDKLLRREDLRRAEAEAMMGEIMDGHLEPAAIAALLTALTVKGETAEELAGLATAMRKHAIPVRAPAGAIDTCGTGGSGADKPNTSSLAALVLASDGVVVAKHGNRSNTGKTGSADLFERLGIPLELGPEAAESLLAEVGMAFLFAPRFHPAMKHAAPVRRALGFRTTFNFLGPLANPAGVTRQVLGVSDPARAPLMAEALIRLGVERALVLCAEDGLDELSLSAPTSLWWVEGGQVTPGHITPEHVGFERRPADDPSLSGFSSIELAASRFVEVLEGRAPEPLLQLVALNAGAGFWVAGRTDDLESGIRRAQEILLSGSAMATLDRFVTAASALKGPAP